MKYVGIRTHPSLTTFTSWEKSPGGILWHCGGKLYLYLDFFATVFFPFFPEYGRYTLVYWFELFSCFSRPAATYPTNRFFRGLTPRSRGCPTSRHVGSPSALAEPSGRVGEKPLIYTATLKILVDKRARGTLKDIIYTFFEMR